MTFQKRTEGHLRREHVALPSGPGRRGGARVHRVSHAHVTVLSDVGNRPPQESSAQRSRLARYVKPTRCTRAPPRLARVHPRK